MAVKQISVFVENKPGKLAELTDLLSQHKINLRALYLADAVDFGIARLIVDDIYNTSTVLREANYVSSIKDVLAVRLPDEPGGLFKVLDLLGKNGINVEYMYAFTTRIQGTANMIFRVEDNKRAVELLSTNGISQIGQEDLEKL